MKLRTTSHYVTMRDGVRIAIDVHRPETDGKLPTIVRQTRYYRAMEPTWLAKRIGEERVDLVMRMRRRFVGAGYAWVDVDVRGSGASTGVWASPWSPPEVADGPQILDWIVAQPWSNGRIGSTGNSYDGTAAELLATTGHPALRAIAPRCSLYDVYTDVAFPGGVRQAWFTASWTQANQGLDAMRPEVAVANAIAQARPWLEHGRSRVVLERVLRLLFRRVRSVGNDRETIERALAERVANLDVDAAAHGGEFRDDPQQTPLGPHTADSFSPSTFADRARAAAVPTLSLSGWFDAAYPHGAIKRHLTVVDPRNQLVIGPWNHGVTVNASPHARSRDPDFDLTGELLRFFDHHLRDQPSSSPSVRYYVMGAEAWRTAASWPPPSRPHRLYLAAERMLVGTASGEGADVLLHDPTTASGRRSRWRTLVSPFVVPDYPDRNARSTKLLAYRSAPLSDDLEIAGHPLLELFVTPDARDGAIFAYLEEEMPDGRIHYVTEGALRLCHQPTAAPPMYSSPVPYRSFLRADARGLSPGVPTAVTFDLLPVAYRFARGSRIRIALATADADHFSPIPDAASSIAIGRGTAQPSALVLPATAP